MGRRRIHEPLEVYMNGRPVGRLNRQASGAIAFAYDEDWLGWEDAIPVSLSLPLREDRFIGAPVRAVFENLLPDNDAIRRRVVERTGAPGTDAYSLLGTIGRDCVGALQFLPEGTSPGPAGAVAGRPIGDDEIAKRLRNLSLNPLGLDADAEFRISIAGAQEKTALLRWKGGWHVPRGTTATTHIFKPRLGVLANGLDLSHSVDNEFFCLRFLAHLGLSATQAAIETFDGERVLVVERFDRHWTRDGRLLRLPQEDCCQALSVPPALKYQSEGGPGMRQVLELLNGSDVPVEDRTRFLTTQVLFWLLAAPDGHAKNFSLFLAPGGRFRMTPLYDVMSAQPNLDAGQLRRNQLRLAMSVGDNRHYTVHEIQPRHFLQTAKRAGIPATEFEAVLARIHDRVPGALDKTRADLPPGCSEATVDSVVNGIKARLRILGDALATH